VRLTDIIKNGASDQVAYTIREHIRRMEGPWDVLTEKAQYPDWHTISIQGKEFNAPLIDIIASPEAFRITANGCVTAHTKRHAIRQCS
jgi:hypothetical protein